MDNQNTANSAYENENAAPKKKKKGLKIFLGIVLGAVGIFVVMVIAGAILTKTNPELAEDPKVTYAQLTANEAAAFRYALCAAEQLAKDPSTVRLNYAKANDTAGAYLRMIIDDNKSNEVLVEKRYNSVACELIPKEEYYQSELFQREMRISRAVENDQIDATRVNAALADFWAQLEERIPEVELTDDELTAYAWGLELSKRFSFDPLAIVMPAHMSEMGAFFSVVNDGITCQYLVTIEDGEPIYKDVTFEEYTAYRDILNELKGKSVSVIEDSSLIITRAIWTYWRAVLPISAETR